MILYVDRKINFNWPLHCEMSLYSWLAHLIIQQWHEFKMNCVFDKQSIGKKNPNTTD